MRSHQKTMKAADVATFEDALASEAIDKLADTYIPWLEKALDSIADSDINKRPNEVSNSIGNLLLHLEGNVHQWIIHGLGGQDDHRDRDSEFRIKNIDNKNELLNALKNTVNEACAVIDNYRSAEKLLAPKKIQGFETTAFAAILHVVEHFSYHTGQIIWIAKSISARDMEFYDL